MTQPTTMFSSLDDSWVDCRPGNPFAAANNDALNEIHDGHLYACGGGGGPKCDPIDIQGTVPVNGKITPKRTKATDIRFHWLRDRECQEQFRIYWRPGKLNYADYWTKHHQGKHHQNVRQEFLTPYTVLEMRRLEKQQFSPAAAAA